MWSKYKINKESTGIMMLNTASSQVFSNVITIIGGLITARLVMPEVYGEFNSFALIISYLPILQIGIMNALNRNLPFYIGKGERAKALAFSSIANFWELSLGILSFIVLSAFSLNSFMREETVNAWGYGTFAISAFHLFYGSNYLQILYRTNHDFNKLAICTVAKSLITFFAIYFVWLWGFEGLCIRQILSCVLEFVLLWYWRPIKVKPTFNKQILWSMIKIGFPIFLVGIVFTYWGTINNTLVLKLGGIEQYGFYAIATIVFSTLSVFSNSIIQVLYPKMSQRYGEGASVKEICHMPDKYMVCILLVLIPSIVLIWFLLPWVMEILLPNYLGGVKAAQWMTLVLVPSVFAAYNNVFNIFNHQMHYLASIVLGFVFYLLALFILYKFLEFDLVIFPISLFIGRTFQLIATSYFIYKYQRT